MMEEFDMQLLNKMIDSYISASKKQKSKIISQYMKLTGIKKRKTATKRFQRYKKPDRLNKDKSNVKLGRPIKYGSIEKEIFSKIWELSGFICAKRLISFIEINKNALYKEYSHYPLESLKKIININEGSAKALISNIPKPKKRRLIKGNCELYKYIAIEANFNKFAKFSPGYFEIDIVEHKNANLNGHYGITLNFVDVYSQYIIRRACLGKDYKTISNLSEMIIQSIPFKVIKLHPDNEKTLLKLAYERSNKNNIEVTRSRAYKKNDNAHIEQKNGDKVRKLVGYYRYDTEYEINLLNQIYEIADIIDNYFIPSYKLKHKLVNEKGQIIKRVYETPKTPYQRIIQSPYVDDKVKKTMTNIFKSLNYIELKKKLNEKLNELFDYKLNKTIKINNDVYELCA